MRWRRLLGALKNAPLFRDLVALWLLAKDGRAPTAPKLIATLVPVYVISPVDLIPDFLPLLGVLDDLILIPLGAGLAARLVPPRLWQETLGRAEQVSARMPLLLRNGLGVLLGCLLAGAAGLWWWLARSAAA